MSTANSSRNNHNFITSSQSMVPLSQGEWYLVVHVYLLFRKWHARLGQVEGLWRAKFQYKKTFKGSSLRRIELWNEIKEIRSGSIIRGLGFAIKANQWCFTQKKTKNEWVIKPGQSTNTKSGPHPISLKSRVVKGIQLYKFLTLSSGVQNF